MATVSKVKAPCGGWNTIKSESDVSQEARIAALEEIVQKAIGTSYAAATTLTARVTTLESA